MGSCFGDYGGDSQSELAAWRIVCEAIAAKPVTGQPAWSDDKAVANGILQQLGLATPSVVVLDHIDLGARSLNDSVGPIVEYYERIAKRLRASPSVKSVILVSRRFPDEASLPIIELRPLNEAQCRRYVANHPQGSAGLSRHKLFERIYAKSHGIPLYVDRMLDELHRLSPADLSDPGELCDFTGEEGEFFVRSVCRSIDVLRTSETEMAQRSYSLLKALAVLSHGEEIGVVDRMDLRSIHHIKQRKPFHGKNVEHLITLGVLDVAPVVDVETAIDEPANEQGLASPKLLAIPRQIRDYIANIIVTKDEHRAIAREAMRLYFGDRWVEGIPSTRAILRHVPGNVFVVLTSLLRDACEKFEDESADLNLLLVAINAYLEELHDLGRFWRSYIVAQEVVTILDRYGHDTEAATISYALGYALRMLGRAPESIQAMERASKLEGDGISKSWRARVFLELAEANLRTGDRNAAAIFAERARKLVPADSAKGLRVQALLVRVDESISKQEARKLLQAIESKARKKKWYTVANNIALSLADESVDVAARNSLRQRVLDSADGAYTACRASVAMAADLVRDGKVHSISPDKRKQLKKAYSYLHGERFENLFSECSSALLAVGKADGNVPFLKRLFQLNSVIWPILTNGDSEEKKWRSELNAVAREDVAMVKNDAGFFTPSFFGGLFRRFMK